MGSKQCTDFALILNAASSYSFCYNFRLR